MSYLDTITDRPLTERELQHQEYMAVMDEIGDLRLGKFSQLVDILGEYEIYLTSIETHKLVYERPNLLHPMLPEFKKVLLPITRKLTKIAHSNRKAKKVKAGITRKRCFELLAYAKKWLGVPMPPNLSKLNLEALRAKVHECFPDGQFPKVTHLSYKGVLAILRGLRLAGHKVTLRAKLPQLLAQVVALVDNWEDSYDLLASAGETYAKVVDQAKQSLLAVFKPPTAPVVVPEAPTQVDSAFGRARP